MSGQTDAAALEFYWDPAAVVVAGHQGARTSTHGPAVFPHPMYGPPRRLAELLMSRLLTESTRR